jgi:hypothetical protein
MLASQHIGIMSSDSLHETNQIIYGSMKFAVPICTDFDDHSLLGCDAELYRRYLQIFRVNLLFTLSYSEDGVDKLFLIVANFCLTTRYCLPEYKWQWLLMILITEQDAKIQRTF